MKRWKLTGIAATLIIIVSLPLYRLKEKVDFRRAEGVSAPAAVFVGSDACKDCHRSEYERWQASHHRRAMDTASETSVHGDFNDARFEHFGRVSRFYRKDGKFYVHTQGPGGIMADFEITHTFGWYPLQQYLVPFEGGRLQCLPIAWDDRQKRWYHLYPDQLIDPSDWLYWTNNGQNWNGMCAECHSTSLKKNYDPDSDTYRTTWSEISVGCEACHGPGSAHVSWAQLPEMGRPPVENDALAVRTGGLSAREQIELCAPCHSRRMSLGDNPHTNIDFLDYAVPQLLSEGYYFADGQILDEVYVYGSFMQSKMYARDVRCSDCHDVHSIKRLGDGNALCLQCHRAAVYDTRDHHFHKKAGQTGEPIKSEGGGVLFEVGSGARCEQCHMPGRTYMGIDYRPDHSFRIPQPDLTLSIGTPNACNRCHADKTAAWSLSHLTKWYGSRKRSHYGTLFAAGRRGEPSARPQLAQLVGDRLYPANVRATALVLLTSYSDSDHDPAVERALTDEAALLRQAAARHLPEPDPHRRLRLLAPLLYDPIKAVRIEAAARLAVVPAQSMPVALQRRFQTVLTEYRQAMRHTADFAASRHNLANLDAELGRFDQAEDNYRKAIAIDDQFYPAKVNLAMLYNRMGNNDGAESLLREVTAAHPELHEIQYSLGLLLAEMQKYDAAADYLQRAGAGLPRRARIHYNLGLLLQRLNRDAAAETALQKALALEPDNLDYLYALAIFYLQRQRLAEARPLAERMTAKHPEQPNGAQLLEAIRRQQSAQ